MCYKDRFEVIVSIGCDARKCGFRGTDLKLMASTVGSGANLNLVQYPELVEWQTKEPTGLRGVQYHLDDEKSGIALKMGIGSPQPVRLALALE